MSSAKNVQKTFERISVELEELGKVIDEILPYAIIKEATAFGNSAHIVLSKDLLDKKVGVIVLDEGRIAAYART